MDQSGFVHISYAMYWVFAFGGLALQHVTHNSFRVNDKTRTIMWNGDVQPRLEKLQTSDETDLEMTSHLFITFHDVLVIRSTYMHLNRGSMAAVTVWLMWITAPEQSRQLPLALVYSDQSWNHFIPTVQSHLVSVGLFLLTLSWINDHSASSSHQHAALCMIVSSWRFRWDQ